jgi:hypothetical protein
MNQLTRVDKAKNRIYIYFEGFLEEERAKKLHDSYKDAITQVESGFTVLTYAENYKPGGTEVQSIVSEMVQMAERAGCKKVARVTGATPLGGMQINRLAKVRTSYASKHFTTAEEAEEYLDSDEDM